MGNINKAYFTYLKKRLLSTPIYGIIINCEIKRWSSVTEGIKNIKDFKGGSLG